MGNYQVSFGSLITCENAEKSESHFAWHENSQGIPVNIALECSLANGWTALCV